MRTLNPELSPKANENWVRLCSSCLLQLSLHTLEKLDSGSSSPSSSSHPYLLSSKEQTVRGCLVSASMLSPVVSHYSSPGLEKGRICLYSSDAGTDWSPCCHGSMNCPWIFISHNTAPAQRPEPELQQSPGTDQSTERPLCSWTWALAAHFSSRTPVLALCFSMHSSQATFYSQLTLKGSKSL